MLRNLDFTAELTGQVHDDAIWSRLDWGAALTQPGAPSVLPRLLRHWTPQHGFLAALATHLVHHTDGDRERAHRAVEQATTLGHPRLAAVAWLALAESLVLRKETATAKTACHRVIETADPGQRPLPWPFDPDDEPGVDVATRAKTLLGALQRDAGDVEAALTTLDGVTHSEDPDAIFVRAQTLLRAGANEAARPEYLRLAGTRYAVAANYDLGLLAFRDGDDDSARDWWLLVVAASSRSDSETCRTRRAGSDASSTPGTRTVRSPRHTSASCATGSVTNRPRFTGTSTPSTEPTIRSSSPRQPVEPARRAERRAPTARTCRRDRSGRLRRAGHRTAGRAALNGVKP